VRAFLTLCVLTHRQRPGLRATRINGSVFLEINFGFVVYPYEFEYPLYIQTIVSYLELNVTTILKSAFIYSLINLSD
jgi:hypothetical protein